MWWNLEAHVFFLITCNQVQPAWLKVHLLSMRLRCENAWRQFGQCVSISFSCSCSFSFFGQIANAYQRPILLNQVLSNLAVPAAWAICNLFCSMCSRISSWYVHIGWWGWDATMSEGRLSSACQKPTWQRQFFLDLVGCGGWCSINLYQLMHLPAFLSDNKFPLLHGCLFINSYTPYLCWFERGLLLVSI